MMLKNLKKNISLLFKQFGVNFGPENLKKLEKSIKENKGFYYDSLNSNLFLKTAIQRRKKLKIQLKREIKMCKFLEKKFENKIRFFPELTDSGKYKNLFWLLEKLEKGKLSGKMENDFGMRKNFLFKISPSFFAKLIHLYQNLRPNISNTHGGYWYLHDFNRYKNNFLKEFVLSKLNKNLLSQKEIKFIERILKENKKFLDKEAKYLSHGDLYPNNLMLNKERELIILDWGLANFNNLAFDVAFIYLMAYRLPGWQKNFLNDYLKSIKEKNKFKKLFKLSLISLTIRLAAFCYFRLKEKPDKKIFSIFKKHIRALKNAINLEKK